MEGVTEKCKTTSVYSPVFALSNYSTFSQSQTVATELFRKYNLLVFDSDP
jgi:hypothetical protein